MSLISVNNLTFGYDGSYNNIFEDVSFNIDTDWKLGLIGRNGKGKTTFLNALSHLSDNVKIVTMDSDEEGICIIELPDEIIDASVSTQLENIKDILNNARV